MAGWDSLLSIMAEAADLDRQAESDVPVDCPNDGVTLIEAEPGLLFCPFDGWRYPDDAGRLGRWW